MNRPLIANPHGSGGVADVPDHRDRQCPVRHHHDHPLPAAVDLRPWCPPVKTQGRTNSCTAHAGTTLVEYYQRRAFPDEPPVMLSRMFLYKVTRNLLQVKDVAFRGDRGANSRTTMKALALFGVPPEEYWPFDETRLYEEPPAFCYALAAPYRAAEYFRIDTAGAGGDEVLHIIKCNLVSFHACMLTCLLYLDSQGPYQQSKVGGKIPLPHDTGTTPLYHTMAAVGYDDAVVVRDQVTGTETTGAFLVKNSWGEEWGDRGYGWLPYEYASRVADGSSGPARLSFDWWTIVKQEWLSTGRFEPKV